MVIAALVSFGILLVAWIVAPSETAPTPSRAEGHRARDGAVPLPPEPGVARSVSSRS